MLGNLCLPVQGVEIAGDHLSTGSGLPTCLRRRGLSDLQEMEASQDSWMLKFSGSGGGSESGLNKGFSLSEPFCL